MGSASHSGWKDNLNAVLYNFSTDSYRSPNASPASTGSSWRLNSHDCFTRSICDTGALASCRFHGDVGDLSLLPGAQRKVINRRTPVGLQGELGSSDFRSASVLCS